MGPAEPVRPVYSAPGSAALGAGKTAAPAKRVAPATRVASPPGISRSVGNKNSSESLVLSPRLDCSGMIKLTAALTSWAQVILPPQPPKDGVSPCLELLTSGDAPTLVSQSAGITGMSYHTQPFFFFSLTLLLRLECSGMISTYCKLLFWSSSNSPASASQIAGITGTCHHAKLIFVFLVEMGFHHLGQSGL
ncbi:hypothetical protein AAY473_037569, partial [Plecturocebus cupreus]